MLRNSSSNKTQVFMTIILFLLLSQNSFGGEKKLLKTKLSPLTQLVVDQTKDNHINLYLNEIEPLKPGDPISFCSSKTANLEKITSLPSEMTSVSNTVGSDKISIRGCGIYDVSPNSKTIINVIDCSVQVNNLGDIKYAKKIIHHNMPVKMVKADSFPKDVKVVTYKGKIPTSVWGDQNIVTDHICQLAAVGNELWINAVSTGGYNEWTCTNEEAINKVFSCDSISTASADTGFSVDDGPI